MTHYYNLQASSPFPADSTALAYTHSPSHADDGQGEEGSSSNALVSASHRDLINSNNSATSHCAPSLSVSTLTSPVAPAISPSSTSPSRLSLPVTSVTNQHHLLFGPPTMINNQSTSDTPSSGADQQQQHKHHPSDSGSSSSSGFFEDQTSNSSRSSFVGGPPSASSMSPCSCDTPASTFSSQSSYNSSLSLSSSSSTSSSLQFRVPAHTLEYCLNGLYPDTLYRVKIQAVNSVGMGPFSSTEKVVTRPLPPLPPCLECVTATPSHLKIRWIADNRTNTAVSPSTVSTNNFSTSTLSSASGASSSVLPLKYTLQMQKHNSAGFQTVYTGSSQSHKVTRLVENTRYNFRILAQNESGEGPPSDVFTFSTTLAAPSQPKGLKVSHVTVDSCQLEWQASKLQQSTAAASSPAALNHTGAMAAAITGNNGASSSSGMGAPASFKPLSYNLIVERLGHSDDAREAKCIEGTKYKLERLWPDTEYSIKVYAVRRLPPALHTATTGGAATNGSRPQQQQSIQSQTSQAITFRTEKLQTTEETSSASKKTFAMLNPKALVRSAVGWFVDTLRSPLSDTQWAMLIVVAFILIAVLSAIAIQRLVGR